MVYVTFALPLITHFKPYQRLYYILTVKGTSISHRHSCKRTI